MFGLFLITKHFVTRFHFHGKPSVMVTLSKHNEILLIKSKEFNSQVITTYVAINVPINRESFTLLQKAAMVQGKKECTKQSFSNLCYLQLARQIYRVLKVGPLHT